MKKLLLTGTIVLLTAVSASAGPEAEHRGHWVSPGQWQMNDIGRNRGVLGGPGIPKCNPWYHQSALVCILVCLIKSQGQDEKDPPSRSRGAFAV